MTGRPGRVPDGVVGATVGDVALQSSWNRPRGRGCELQLALSSGHTVWVVCTPIRSVDETLATWRARRGAAVAKAWAVTDWPLADGGHQQTLELLLDDSHRFHADLIEAAPSEAAPTEREWVFEGTPGVEMGQRDPPT